MANYYSILKKTISGMAHNSQGTRNAVFGKARTAIDRQLRAMEPTPSEEAIARQMQLLEVAINKLDTEYSQIGEQKPAEAPKQAPKQTPLQAPLQASGPTSGEAGVKISGQVAGQAPRQDPGLAKNYDATQQSFQTSTAKPDQKSEQKTAGNTDAAPVGVSQPGYVPAGSIKSDNLKPDAIKPESAAPAGAVAGGGVVGDKLPGAPIGASAGASPQVYAGEGQATADPKGMDYAETILAADPDTRARAEGPGGKKVSRGGIFSTLLAILLAIGVVVGGLYALWLNKEALIDAVIGEDKQPVAQSPQKSDGDNINAGSDTEAVKIEIDQPNVRTVGDENKPKSATRLTPDGETVEADPLKSSDDTENSTSDLASADNNQSTGQSTSVSKQPVENSPTPSDAANADGSAQKVVEVGQDGQPVKSTANDAASQSGDEGAETAQRPAQEDKTATQIQSTPPVAQKAYLYEEGTAGASASRDNAAIIWSLGHEVIAGGATEAVIKGQLDVPGRNLAMSLVIKRNRDISLPASHIIELVFQIPADFSGGNISEVSRFVMKTSEQGRGEGLIAVPAKISDGSFLIALNNLDQALATNHKLLLESSWIDVPLGYTTGRRALVTLEKGALGDKVFRDAFADWEKR